MRAQPLRWATMAVCISLAAVQIQADKGAARQAKADAKKAKQAAAKDARDEICLSLCVVQIQADKDAAKQAKADAKKAEKAAAKDAKDAEKAAAKEAKASEKAAAKKDKEASKAAAKGGKGKKVRMQHFLLGAPNVRADYPCKYSGYVPRNAAIGHARMRDLRLCILDSTSLSEVRAHRDGALCTACRLAPVRKEVSEGTHQVTCIWLLHSRAPST